MVFAACRRMTTFNPPRTVGIALFLTACTTPSTDVEEPPTTEVSIPSVSFALDRAFPCRVSSTDTATLALITDRYGVETVADASALAVPGEQVKFLPDPIDPNDGELQMPQALWDDAETRLPEFQVHWSSSKGDARGQVLMRRIVEATGVPFPFEQKTIKLYLCPGLGAAYQMGAYPFYPYLASVYADERLRWTLRDFADLYMLHEILHWYLLYQPWLRVWTPNLEETYQQYLEMDPEFVGGGVVFPPSPANPDIGKDAYPELHFNQVNLLGHLHLNAIRRTIYASEPEAWEYAKNREKQITQDPYYAGAIDFMEAQAPERVESWLDDVKHNPARGLGSDGLPLPQPDG